VERTEFEKEVLEKNEKIADLKERLQVKFALFSRARSIFSCSRSLSLVSTLYSLLPNLYSLLSRSIYPCQNFLWHTARLESSFPSRAIFCLQEKKSETAIELRYLAKESKATYSCTQRSREKQLRDLMDQCTLVEDELAIEQRATTMQQEFLQRKLAALSEKSLDVQTKNDKDSNDKTKLLEQLTEEQTVNKERLFDLEKKYQYDVNTRAAKAEEERRMLELQVSACACVFVSTFCVCRRA